MNLTAIGTDSFDSDFRLYLQSELAKRCKKNPRYSLRAFADLLGMDASSVSQLLSGKRKASTKVIELVSTALSTHPEQKRLLIEKAKNRRRLASSQLASAEQDYALIAKDTFSFMAEWYHYAILEFIAVEGFQNKPAWIARSLGIESPLAKEAIQRMIRLGLIRDEQGRLFKTNKFVTNFEPGMTSAAHKSLQRDIVTKALEAIDNVAQNEKDITSVTMAIDIEKLPEARKLIAQFRRQLCNFLEDGKQVSVYNLGIQLYPLTKKINSQNNEVENEV